MTQFIKVATTSDISENIGLKVEVGDHEIALFNVNGAYYALSDMCPHRGGPLSEGPVEGKLVACPWHGWEFDVTTGLTPVNSATKVACYKVKVDGTDVLVEV